MGTVTYVIIAESSQVVYIQIQPNPSYKTLKCYWLQMLPGIQLRSTNDNFHRLGKVTSLSNRWLGLRWRLQRLHPSLVKCFGLVHFGDPVVWVVNMRGMGCYEISWNILHEISFMIPIPIIPSLPLLFPNRAQSWLPIHPEETEIPRQQWRQQQ
jgi:hypothetical protein